MTLRVHAAAAVGLSLEPWRKEGSAGRKEGGQRRNLSGVLMHAVPTKTRSNPRITEGGATARVFSSLQGPSLIYRPQFLCVVPPDDPTPFNHRRFFSLQLDIPLHDAERCGGGKACSIVPLLYLFFLSRASLTSALRTFWLGMDPTPSHHPPQLLSGSSSVVSFSGASLSFCGSGPSSAS